MPSVDLKKTKFKSFAGKNAFKDAIKFVEDGTNAIDDMLDSRKSSAINRFKEHAKEGESKVKTIAATDWMLKVHFDKYGEYTKLEVSTKAEPQKILYSNK